MVRRAGKVKADVSKKKAPQPKLKPNKSLKYIAMIPEKPLKILPGNIINDVSNAY